MISDQREKCKGGRFLPAISSVNTAIYLASIRLICYVSKLSRFRIRTEFP